MNEKDFLKEFYGFRRELYGHLHEIQEVSNALYALGMDRAAIQIEESVTAICEGYGRVQDAYGDELRAQVEDGWKKMGETIKMTLSFGGKR